VRLPEAGLMPVRRPVQGWVTTAPQDPARLPSFVELRFTLRSPNSR
jgi:hypothetical protein